MIHIEGLEKRFGTNEVLAGIDLTINKGGITAILGPNGSGKTTLIKCLLGLVKPDKGSILVDGEDIKNGWLYRRKIDYLPQLTYFPENLRLRELVRMIIDIRQQPDRSNEMIELFSLEPYINVRIGNLSGGTRQKVNLILALMFDNPIVIMDEPTVGLDPVSLIRLKNLLRKESELGKMILVTSHIMSFVEEMAEDIVFLLEGKIRYNGTVGRLRTNLGSDRLEEAIAKLLEETNETNSVI